MEDTAVLENIYTGRTEYADGSFLPWHIKGSSGGDSFYGGVMYMGKVTQ